MRQVLQRLDTGETELVEAPAPSAQPGTVLITTRNSLISAGTERMLVEFGRASYLTKARQNPERVRMVLNKVRTDGLLQTFEAVRSKLSQPIPLGYCNVGVVSEIGAGVSEFRVGDRVVSNGPHADVVRVSKNLCARIPDGVSDEAAVFSVIASVGLQGVRLSEPTLGEAFVVMGAGLIGLLTVQLLSASGCRVLAVDYDPERLKLAQKFGAEVCNLGSGEDPVAAGLAFSHGRGVDGVLITASTDSNDPVSQSARMSRKRGRIILVGVAGLELDRAEFYEKELTFQVSCSYGPGRYDASYEENGIDYPLPFVRWTEQRNFSAVLELLQSKRLVVDDLITHKFSFDDAVSAYRTLTSDAALGILLQYDAVRVDTKSRNVSLVQNVTFDPAKPVIGMIGAGNYASRILIPAFKESGAQLKTLVSSSGITSVVGGRSGGFAEASSDVETMLADPQITTVAIVTRHDSHASFVVKALQAGKHVFVEKPLALTNAQLLNVEVAWRQSITSGEPKHVMVGFNRRFAPQVMRMHELLRSTRAPKSFIITVNAGDIPRESWVQSDELGGGRIVGEACHFIDLMRFLADSKIVSIQARRMAGASREVRLDDKATITLGFEDGSLGTINYFANGHSSFPKERVEVFCAGRILQLDNFLRLRGFGWPKFKSSSLWRQDKGQRQCPLKFLDAVSKGGATPIPFDEILEVSRATIEAADLLRLQA